MTNRTLPAFNFVVVIVLSLVDSFVFVLSLFTISK